MKKIPQELLEEYSHLLEMEKQRKELRIVILALVKKGVPVEPGAYTVDVVVRNQQPLTTKALIEEFGEDRIADFKAGLPSVEVEYLRVREAKSKDQISAAGKKPPWSKN